MRLRTRTKVVVLASVLGCGGAVDHGNPPAEKTTESRDAASPEKHVDAGPEANRDAALIDVGRPSPPPPRPAVCVDDSQCPAGLLCYGDVNSNGSFADPYCRSGCLAASDYTRYCLNDRHCCDGMRCILGGGEREGLCVVP